MIDHSNKSIFIFTFSTQYFKLTDSDLMVLHSPQILDLIMPN